MDWVRRRGGRSTDIKPLGSLATAARLATLMLASGMLAATSGAAAGSASLGAEWEGVELGDAPAEHLSLAAYGGTTGVAWTLREHGGAGLAYATCSFDCGRPGAWHQAVIATNAIAQNPSLAFDPWGRAHLAFQLGRSLVYSSCEKACGMSQAWRSIELATVSAHDRDYGTATFSGISLALDEWGRPRIAYIDEDGTDGAGGPLLSIASCDGACGDPTGWITAPISMRGTAYPAQPDLGYVGTRPRITFTGQIGLTRAVYYAECEMHCLGSQQWIHVRVPINGPSLHGHFALDFDGNRPRLGVGSERALYAACDSGCASETGWSAPTVVDDESFAGHADMVLVGGRPHLVYAQLFGDRAYRAACITACTSPAGWETESLSAVTGPPKIVADGERLRLAYVKDTDRVGFGRLTVRVCDASCGAPAAIGPPSGTPAPSTSTFPPPQTPQPRPTTASPPTIRGPVSGAAAEEVPPPDDNVPIDGPVSHSRKLLEGTHVAGSHEETGLGPSPDLAVPDTYPARDPEVRGVMSFFAVVAATAAIGLATRFLRRVQRRASARL